MNTAEMWIKAQADECVYECTDFDLIYSKSSGLVENDDYYNTVYVDEFGGYTLDKFMSFKWEKTNNYMTIEEAEKKYGIKIIRN